MKTDLEIILRACDAVEAVNNHGKRPVCPDKKECVKKCLKTVIDSIYYMSFEGFTYGFTIIEDNLSKTSKDFINQYAIDHDIKITWKPCKGTGNIASFKTCYEHALSLDDQDQIILFIEDDYLCHEAAFSEIIKFFKKFECHSNRIFLNPTTDIGDFQIVNEKEGKYEKTIVLPSSKLSIGVWWKQTWHSTSTFVTNLKTLRFYSKTFDTILKQDRLNQYIRNKIYNTAPCFTPLFPLMQHFQKSKTMYWFDDLNKEREITYFCQKV